MSVRKVTPADIEEGRVNSAKLVKYLEQASMKGKARIYVKFLKKGYALKPLEVQHQELLNNYTEDKKASFVGMMLNSSAPVSAYNTIAKFAPTSKTASQDLLDTGVSMIASLEFRECPCSARKSYDHCLFRKLSFLENRKMQKELVHLDQA